MDPHSTAPKKNTSHGNEVLPQDTTHLIQKPCYQQGSPCQDPAGNWTTGRPDDRKEMQTAVGWPCFPKENWIGEQCNETAENLRKNNSKTAYQLVKDLTTVKQGKATTVLDRSRKCLTEERQILNRWTEYCSELYNYKANGDPSVLNCPQTDTEDDHPILRREVEAAVQSLKKGKSAGVNNIQAELVQAGGEDVSTALMTICNKIWQTGEWPTQWTQSLVITLLKKGNLQQC